MNIAEYEDQMSQLLYITDLRDNDYSWADIAKEVDVGSETAARRLYRKLVALEQYPPDGIEHADFTRENLSKTIHAKVKTKQRYIITSITPRSDTNRKAFLSLKKAAEELNAELIVLLGRGHNKPLQTQIPHYDPWLKPYMEDNSATFTSEYVFNNSIRVVDVQINPQQLNPLTGLKGINWGEHELSSVIVATPQMCLETVPRGNSKTPRILAGTGTISSANYLKDTRTGIMAEQNHQCGAFIVEIRDSKKFFIRPLEIDAKTGTFYDIAKGVCRKYTPRGSKPAKAKTWVLGDKHIGHECEVVEKGQSKLAKIVNPESYVLHDLIDGSSVSHHTWNKTIKRLKSPFMCIQDELNAVSTYLNKMKSKYKKAQGYIIDSNHHDHISQYIDDGRYIKDKMNFEIAHRMVVELLDGKNPLKSRCDKNGDFIWTKSTDDVYIEGVNIGMHGHRGPNGSRGNLKNISNIEKSAIIGHSHSPGMYRNILQIGHSSQDRHGYNTGPSGWLVADGLIYPKGLKQLIIYVDGEFCM